MKKMLCLFLALLLLSLCLTGCGPTVPRPDIKEGEFDVSVTYEVSGVSKKFRVGDLKEYDGVYLTIEGTSCRAWNGHFDGYEVGDLIEVSEIEGGKIALCFLIYPEYFMGEPDYATDFYPHVLTNYIYYEDGVEIIDDDQELIAESYGVKIIGCEYDTPIENEFGMFK